MKILNRLYFLNKGILVGDKNYNYKIKSLVAQKLYSNYIYNFDQCIFFLKKAINLTIENSKNHNLILIYLPLNIDLKKIFLLNKNLIIIFDKWVPGSLSNFKAYKKYNNININKIPDLVILLGNSFLDNLDILDEASSFSVPVITVLPNNIKFDNLHYPIFGNVNNLSLLNFYSIFFLNCIIHGLFERKLYLNYILKNKN